MTRKRNDLLIPENSGFFQELILRLKLIWRLMGDRRVNFLLKILPVASLVYLFWPIDAISLPVIGALDDAAVLWVGSTLFVSLCPEEVVQEHLNSLRKVITGAWRDAPPSTEIVAAEPSESDDE
ncbi:MAG: YkvA family protein [Anaerolineales bacterium]